VHLHERRVLQVAFLEGDRGIRRDVRPIDAGQTAADEFDPAQRQLLRVHAHEIAAVEQAVLEAGATPPAFRQLHCAEGAADEVLPGEIGAFDLQIRKDLILERVVVGDREWILWAHLNGHPMVVVAYRGLMPAVRCGWAVVAAVGACLPFFGALSLTRIFYVRDLTTIFWPQHVWLRGALVRLWDPYLGGGQPAYANALNQMFFPPAALLRMLLPPVIGFNLTVALPLPIAALGTWMFLRRHVSPVAATAGALVFAVSGPMVSTGNMPNLAWSVAWLPWVLWSVECEPSRRSFALTALLVALQALSGEPVTL